MPEPGTAQMSGDAWRVRRSQADVQLYRRRGWWRDRTHIDDFLRQVRDHPRKIAIVSYVHDRAEPTTLSYGELGESVEQCARKFIEMGVQRGDVITLHLPNTWQFPVLALAALCAGAVPNPVPIIYRELELSFMLKHAKSKVLVVPNEFRGFHHAALALKLQREIDTLLHIVTVGERVDDLPHFESDFLSPGRRSKAGWPWRHNERADAATRKALKQRSPRPEDAAVLLFTSGTTGMPKAAVHSHNTIWSAGRPVPFALHMTPKDVTFMASTMGHLTGFYWGMLLPLSLGQKVVYQDVWDAPALLNAIEKDGITWTLSATPFAIDLVDAQRKHRRSIETFRAFVCGGAAIPPAVAIEVKDVLGVDLVSLWGCTEVGICTIHELGAPIDILANSDGMRVEWMDLRIVDEDRRPVEEGVEGRLQVRGPSVFEGYLNQPELTREIQLDDGWCDTGDVGRQTPDGGVRITGRSKDIIIRGGQNIPVVEIENELLKHSKVKEVVVVGVPDPRLGERGCAVVVAQGDAPTLDELKRHLETAGMAKQFWPEYIEIVDAMPRTPSGKVQKFVLRDRLAQKDWALRSSA